jgi:hypothetical protein
MLDISVRVRNSREADDCLPDLRAKILAGGVPDHEQTFLLDAVTSTMELWSQQMSQPYATAMKADKEFEGEGYKVVLSVRPSTGGFIGAIKRMFGRT